ncbi:hypothetical protein [Cytobacillus purgationiresistens]|uniref:Lipoprotein YvcA n=1 Tax=Cytobacillus purgationiresistens TaxID=863449 RepID=A0ABU0ASA7_9BACI|nr:hypothetical protein [Cytobacillus purgationiresistens]MDQ0273318.1 hypothetical protein [Cytobacillus purgationiresistens]
MNENDDQGKEVNSESEARASQEEFTRDFLVSTEEEENEYYLFKSKTDAYTMLFPENAIISKVGYEQNHDVYETFNFSENVRDENLAFYYTINFDSEMVSGDVDLYLKKLSRYTNYEGEYEEFEHEGKTYYYAEHMFEVEEEKAYNYFSLIKPNNSDKALRFVARSSCLDFDKECTPDQEHIKEKFLKMMKTVEFID